MTELERAVPRRAFTDPVEVFIADWLDAIGVRWEHDSEKGRRLPPLDFYLPDFDVFIEVKQFHTPRIATQLAAAPNVILVQGMGAAKALSRLWDAQEREAGRG